MPLFLKALSDIEGRRRPCQYGACWGASSVDHDEACGSVRWHPRLLPRPSNHGRWLPSGSPRGERLTCRPQCGASGPICPYLSDSCRSFGPPVAGTLAESKDALSQSIWSALPSRSNKVRCNSSHTPLVTFLEPTPEQVIPEPQPISLGRASPWGYFS